MFCSFQVIVNSMLHGYKLSDYLFWREKFYKTRIQHADTYYVIRRRSGKKLKGSSSMGICSFLLFNLGDINYADINDYIPVVDMKSYENTYLMSTDVNRYNAWNFFFESKHSPDIKKLCSMGNVIVSDGIARFDFPDYDLLMENDYGHLSLERWRYLLSKYIKIKKDIESAVCSFSKKYIKPYKVLGVLCRGSDYLLLMPKKHPIQPDPQEVICEARRAMNEYHFDKIFLATEDKKIFFKFQETFQNKMIYYSKPCIEYINGFYIKNVNFNTQERYRNGRDYLISMLILSCCNGLIGGITSGLITALLFSNHYDYVYYWRMGYYS